MLNVFTSSPDVADLEQLWKHESPGILHNKKDTTNAEKVTTYQRISISRSDGKYSVQLPWTLEHPHLPTNLTHKLTNPTDHEPLTTAHLLHGRRVTTLPYQTRPPNANLVAHATTSDYSTLIKRAHQQKKMIDHFRDRWKFEYLTALREYHSTTGQITQTIKQGDVVQIHGERQRTTWKLAVI